MHESSALVIAADEQLVDDCDSLWESETERGEERERSHNYLKGLR